MKKECQNYIVEKYPDISFIDESMKKHSTFGVGGSAKLFLLPKKETEIKNILRYSKEHNIKIFFRRSIRCEKCLNQSYLIVFFVCASHFI